MKFHIFLLFLCFMAWPVMAQDSGLYDRLPEKAAFVRFMNFGGDDPAVFTLNGQEQNPLSQDATSPYKILVRPSVDIRIDGEILERDVMPGKFYSVIAVPGQTEPVFLEDEKLSNGVKSIIHFYNFSDRLTLSLKAKEGKISIAMANQKDGRAREINPVPVTLAIYEDRQKLADVPEISLERGKATTIVAYGSGENIKVLTAQSEIDPEY